MTAAEALTIARAALRTAESEYIAARESGQRSLDAEIERMTDARATYKHADAMASRERTG